MKITNVPDKDLERFWEFQIKYLGNKSLDYIKKVYAKNNDFFIQCFEGNELIGIAYGKDSKPFEIELKGIAVKDEFKRKGTAKKMLDFFEKIAVKKGYKRVSAGAAKGPNENVVGFYVKCGYIEIEDKKDYVVVEKSLDNVL